MNKGCLINFEELKVGHALFHIRHGKVVVSRIEDEKQSYPIYCAREEVYNDAVNSESLDDIDEDFTVDINGKEYSSDKYPSVYSRDPFEYTKELLRNVVASNNALKEVLRSKSQ